MLALLFAYSFQADRMEIVVGERGNVFMLYGNVKVQGKRVSITAGAGIYYEASGYSELYGDALVRGRDWTLKGDTVKYRPGDREYLLVSGDAQLEDRHRVIFADRIEVLGDSATAEGNVAIYAKARRVLLAGDTGRYDLAEKAGLLLGAPVALVMREDTLRVGALRFVMRKDTLWAVGGVSVFSRRIQGEGELLRVLEKPDDSTDLLLLAGEPAVLRWKDGSAQGDSILLVLVGGKINRAKAMGNAVARRRERETTLTLMAQELEAWFREEEVERVLGVGLSFGEYRGGGP